MRTTRPLISCNLTQQQDFWPSLGLVFCCRSSLLALRCPRQKIHPWAGGSQIRFKKFIQTTWDEFSGSRNHTLKTIKFGQRAVDEGRNDSRYSAKTLWFAFIGALEGLVVGMYHLAFRQASNRLKTRFAFFVKVGQIWGCFDQRFSVGFWVGTPACEVP